jgi:outer membrane lipoprotein-sorting protein
MNVRIAAPLALLAGIGLVSAVSVAQDKKPATTNPIGAGNWSQTVSKEPAQGGQELDKKQIDLLRRVSTYFNQMPDLKGGFVQTSADGKRIRGKFLLVRPAKFRFDYSSPSKLVIVSDGDLLRVMDHDLMTDSPYRLDETPFRVLMKKDVDLQRDAKIVEVQDVNDTIVVALQDKSPDAPGQIRVLLSKKPSLELKEWITTDAQGLDTRVELSEVSKAEDVDQATFKPPSLTLKRLQQQ